jgi:agmatine deiminase
MPAEWEPHAATWLVWPTSRDWPGKLAAVRWVYSEFIRLLTAFERVRLIVKDTRTRQAASTTLRAAGVDVTRVDFLLSKTNRTWARDSLPLFVTRLGDSVLGAVKWRFNGWARYRDFLLDDAAGKRVAKTAADVQWQPHASVDAKDFHVVLEGGSVDVDGAGTLLTTRRCLLGSPCTRNPGLTQQDLEALLLNYLGASKVLWLSDGIAGDDTSGHVDDFARFVSKGRVVVAAEANSKDDNYVPLKVAKEELESFRDAQGKKLDVIPLPMPSPVVYRGERLPASYANFYVANEQVLVPTFNDPNDRIALGILAELFPGRRVVGIHATELVVGLGTLHCSSQQEPS